MKKYCRRTAGLLRTGAAGVSLSLGLIAMPAIAQDAAGAETDDSTIIVTATRRSEALSDVPIAVSAVTGDTLEKTGATDVRALGQVAPSLLVSGASTRQIADQTSLTVATVHTYLKRIYSKLGVHSRVELVARMVGTTGSVPPPPGSLDDVEAAVEAEDDEDSELPFDAAV